jgi:hypothetical protein
MGYDVVSEATADLVGIAAVQTLEIAGMQILDSGTIQQVLIVDAMLWHELSPNQFAALARVRIPYGPARKV